MGIDALAVALAFGEVEQVAFEAFAFADFIVQFDASLGQGGGPLLDARFEFIVGLAQGGFHFLKLGDVDEDSLQVDSIGRFSEGDTVPDP